MHVLTGLALCAAVSLDFTRRLRPERLMSWWSQRMLGIFGIRVRISGAPVAGGHVTVANHVSWLDIPLIGAVEPTRFVSKSEVRHWPVAGWFASASGTFFIRRGKGGARPLLNQLAPHLQTGGSMTFFPEGTTTDGSDVLPFHPRLFAAPIEARHPVQPVALRYGPSSAGASIAPFVGDDDLLSHLLRLLRNPALQAEVMYCSPIEPEGLDREQLARAARTAIQQALQPAEPALALAA